MLECTTMDQGFWEKLKKPASPSQGGPFFALAPMADVTDTAFREIIAKYSEHGTTHGGPDVFWTEFVSCDGLASKGREVLLRDLEYTKGEHPIVAQVFGAHPENFYKAGLLIRELGFDGADINMGCPDRSVEKQGAGAALIKNPDLAKELIAALKEGSGGLPVSVKTRVGYNKDQIDEWISMLLGEGLAALTIHARTRKEMSKVPARWSDVKRVVELRDAMGVKTLIIGNGDVTDMKDGEEKARESGADGVMLGRAIFGNPWLFNKNIQVSDVPLEEKLRVMVEHTKLFEKKLGDIKNFAIMKKHYKAYVHGFDGAKELRMELMETADVAGIERITARFLAKT